MSEGTTNRLFVCGHRYPVKLYVMCAFAYAKAFCKVKRAFPVSVRVQSKLTGHQEATMLRIGVIVWREWSWPPAFIDEVNKRNQDVVAEYASLGGTRMDEPCPYAVIVDRISHEVPYYRSYLKQAMLQGSYVINNPFMWTADDKFFGASLITKLGVASPKTVALPNKDYIPGIVHN